MTGHLPQSSFENLAWTQGAIADGVVRAPVWSGMTHVITAAYPDDAATLGPLHLRNWLHNYTDAGAGIDESWIREHRGSYATAEGVARWREFIDVADQHPHPAPHFCRVVRFGTEIVGYLCGHWETSESVTLGPMYVLDHAQDYPFLTRRLREWFLFRTIALRQPWRPGRPARLIRLAPTQNSRSGERRRPSRSSPTVAAPSGSATPPGPT
ncbi:hypothetical protein ACFVT5_40740 [Streptomyces sp. NPDC058001]|uniref:hypothetical protein n=1 Tax=Streptomyces sp. NPDC058001 TaxID=3346300 RepID=UPI0036EB4109